MVVEMTEISFVVPAYNEEEWIERCVDCIRNAAEQTELRYEVIVADNRSTDRTATKARQAGAQVVRESVRQIARVRNTGARQAKGTFLVFVDADTLISPELVERTVQRLRSGEVVGGGATLTLDRELRWSMKVGLHVWNTISKRFRLAAGSYLFCRRDVFEDVGGFNENLYASEELDLSVRLKRRGNRNGYAFEILEGHPVITSARKMDWYSGWELWLNFIMAIFMPWAIYYRFLCGFWYDRPDPGTENGDSGRG